jgi:hypothetical protein
MHFTVHFLLDLLLVVAATAAPTGPDSDSSEQHITKLPESAFDEDSCGLKMLQVADAMAYASDDASILSFSSIEEEGELSVPAAPVLRVTNPKRPASIAVDMNSASLNAAIEAKKIKRRMVSKLVRKSRAPATKEPPMSLIELQHTSKGGSNEATVLNVWKVWNEQLRTPEQYHAALIEKYDGSRLHGPSGSGKGWEEQWFAKYRYYKELGEEIDKRVKDGKSLEEVIARLEVIRMSIYNLKSVKALVEGIRIARDEMPFVPARNGQEVDIKDALEADDASRKEGEEDSAEKNPPAAHVLRGTTLRPASLIELQQAGNGGSNGTTVLSLWEVWDEQLRTPDPFHAALIEKYRNKVNGGSGKTWAEKG